MLWVLNNFGVDLTENEAALRRSNFISTIQSLEHFHPDVQSQRNSFSIAGLAHRSICGSDLTGVISL
jgi:hypothetical protein